jgi:hypothetical protein
MCLLPNLQVQDLKEVSQGSKKAAKKAVDFVVHSRELLVEA